MAKINVASVQQYTVDRLKVSLTWPFEVSVLRGLTFSLIRSDGINCTNQLMTIRESNPWQYTEEESSMYIYLNRNTHLDAGEYTFTLYNKGVEIYSSTLTLNYMEDVRVSITKAELVSLDALKISLSPINSIYQSKEMLKNMNFSIVDSITGTFYSDNFTSLSSSIENSSEPIREFTVKLKSGKTLPDGNYDLRLTSVYKSRTFSVVEKRNTHVPFMTTTPPAISSSYITTDAFNNSTLFVIFAPFIEKGMLNSGRRLIINENGKDISSWFNADRISATSYSLAGISYISKIEIPLISEFYSLKKGKYTIKWTWDSVIIPDVSFTFDTSWVVNPVSSINTFRSSFIDIDLPVEINTSELNSYRKCIIEYKGSELTGTDRSELFGDLIASNKYKYGNNEVSTSHIGIELKDSSKVKRGVYTFIIYHESDNTKVYDYIGNIDIIKSFTPEISSVIQTDVDTLTIYLKNERPIEVIEQYSPILLNQYGSINYSSRLLSIVDSNIWDAQEYMTSEFNVVLNDSSNLSSGSYLFKLEYKGEEVTEGTASIQYMETRKGLIQDITQTSISSIRITFSEPQTRQFLLSTTFSVERRVDGADYTDRFELLENVLKADQSIFHSIDLPMDHEDSFPAGRYRISFLFVSKNAAVIPQTIYAFDAELGFMTNNIPSIKSITTSKLSGNILNMHILFGNYLEGYLFNSAVFSINRFDGVDISSDFTNKGSMTDTEWELETTNLRGITYIRGINLQTSSNDVSIERGNYTVEFAWPDIQYLNTIKKSVFLEYQLPVIKYGEVSNVSTQRNWARIYFELDKAMQYEYFEELQLEVLDESGNDVTNYFDTIQNANNIDPTLPDEMKLSMDNFNVDIINLEEITFGTYQFIFYHVIGGIRGSHNMYSLDISFATSPRIATAEQVEINKLMITLRNPIPRMLLENFTFTFAGTNLVDHTEKFMSIDSANDWPENLREVTSFYIQIKSGYYCDEGSYLFTMYNGNTECDGYIFDIERLEGVTGEIISTKPVNLSTLEIVFREEESAIAFRSISLQVLDANGVDVSNKFDRISNSAQMITTDYFDTINLSVVDSVAAGTYEFIFYKTFKNEQKDIASNIVTLPYMSNSYPLLYQVSATKLGSVMTGDDALIMWFNPPLEKTLFDNAKFGIFRTANMDVELTSKFRPITNAILDVETKNGITYITNATLEFANKGTLNRDNYTVVYYWDGEFSYMKNLERDIRLDYILFPVKSIEQVRADELLVTFKNPVSANTLKNSELIVNTTYQTENIDGTVLTEVDFSTQFKSLQETNDFSSASTFETVTVKMGTRDVKEYTLTLTEDNYNNYLGKRVRLAGDTESGFQTLMNVLDESVELTTDNVRLYYGKVVQTVGSDNSVIEVLTESNKLYYIGEYVKIYKPDPEWLNKEVDIYCNEAESILPEGNYRFIIAETLTDKSGTMLQYAYAGDCDIVLMVDTSILGAEATVTQSSYDTLLFTFSKPQLSNVLNLMTPIVKYVNNSTGDVVDYSSMFKSMINANAYSRDILDVTVKLSDKNVSSYIGRRIRLSSQAGDIVVLTSENYSRYIGKNIDVYKDEAENGIYEYGKDKDTVINEIHYGIRVVPKVKSVIDTNKFIPPHNYSLGFLYNGIEYFNVNAILPFMTSTPPEISSMSIEDKNLLVEFNPKVELNALNASSFSIMINRGLKENEDGSYSVKGTDVTNNFRGILGSRMSIVTEGGIQFVSDIRIPVKENAFLASGKYTLTWTWPTNSFFPDSVYTGGLNVLAKGIKSVRTISGDTIEVILEKEVNTSSILSMELSVKNSSGENVTSFFRTMEEANSGIISSESTDRFYVIVEEDDVLTTNTYTFSLLEGVVDEDEIANVESVEMLSWSMNIVYLAGDFPTVNEANNMSTRKYSIVDLTDGNYLNYLGKMVQLYTSNLASEIEKLTRKNAPTFIDKTIRVFNDAQIDHFTVEIDEMVDSSLINALQVTIKDNNGIDITENFSQPYENATFETIQRLKGLFFKFTRFIDGAELRNYDVQIALANGIDITNQFLDINAANTLEDDVAYNQFYLMLDTEADINEKDIKDLSIIIRDTEGYLVDNYSYETLLKNSLESKTFDIYLNSNTTVNPGYYSLDFSYTNEPDIEGSVVIHPFSWNGLLPFFSTDLGTIDSVEITDMETISVTLSNPDLPTALFNDVEFQLVDEDGDVVDVEFEKIAVSNELDGFETIGEMDIPNVIKLKLVEGEELESGVYNIQFMMDIFADFVADEGEDDETEIETSNKQSYPMNQYCLWEKTESIPHMFREMTNTITSIDVIGIDTLKVTLEKAINVELLKEFLLDLYDKNRDIIYTDLFQGIEESNFFGRYIMATDNRYIMYSGDSVTWSRFDTGYSYGFTKVFRHENSEYYFVLCTNGKILKFKEFKETTNSSEKAATEVSYNVTLSKKSLNDFLFIDTNTIIIVGNDGVILKGTINSSGNMSLSFKTTTNTNTLTSISKDSDGVIYASGYRGTLLKSTDNGETWAVIKLGIIHNLTDVYCYEETVTIENEDDDQDESEDDEEETVISSATPTTETHKFVFVTGTNGTLLYSENGDEFEVLDSGVSSGLFSVSSYKNTIVIVGDNGVILTIEDNEDDLVVTEADSSVSFALRDVKWCNNHFVACGANGSWVTSIKGMTWTLNSSMYSSALKCADYVESQYNTKKANYFYMKLRTGQEIGAVSFYSGEEEPTLESSFCASWATSESKLQHVNDIYIQTYFDPTEYRSIAKKYYRFCVTNTENVIDDEENIVNVIREFAWSEIASSEIDHSGSFFGRIRLKSEEDPTKWQYSTESAVNLPYMTSTPGTITNVSVCSPDTEEGVEFVNPFLKVEIDSFNENALYYANYQLLNENGVDYTSYFKSLRVCNPMYSASYTPNGYYIYGNDIANNLPAGKYTLVWKWMALGSEEIHITDITVKPMSKLAVASSVDKDTVTIMFTKPIPRNYFIANGDSLNLDFNIRKIPDKADADPIDILNSSDVSDLNYYWSFKPIGDGTESSNIITVGTDVAGIALKINSDYLSNGTYVIKFNNPDYEYPAVNYSGAVKETDTQLWISTTKVDITRPLVSKQPTIHSVDLEKYYPIPNTNDGYSHANQVLNGDGEPSELLAQDYTNWVTAGESALKYHVGDHYTDNNSGDTYYFNYNKWTGEYEWQKNISKIYLSISFGECPILSLFDQEYIDFELKEIDQTTKEVKRDLKSDGSKSYWRVPDGQTTGIESTNYWIIESRKLADSPMYQISKIYIPLDETANFPGASYAKFTMKFKGETDTTCYYKDISYEGFNLSSATRSYGNIAKISCFNPNIKEDVSNTDAGLTIKLEREQLPSFMQSLNFSITHTIMYEEEIKLTEENIDDYYGKLVYNGDNQFSLFGEVPKIPVSTTIRSSILATFASSEKYLKSIPINSLNRSQFIGKKVTVTWYETIDESARFKSIAESNPDLFESGSDDRITKFRMLLADGQVLDHDEYSVTFTGAKSSTDLIEAEKVPAYDDDGNVLKDSSGEIIYEDAMIEFSGTVTTPWLTTAPPTSITAKLDTTKPNPVLQITFDKAIAFSSLYKKNTELTIQKYVDDEAQKGNYAKRFRKIKHVTTTFLEDENVNIDSNESYITKVKVLMASGNAMPKGTFNVQISFPKSTKLSSIPNEKEKYCQFTLTESCLSKIGVFSKVDCNKKKLTVALKKLPAISSNAKLAKSSIGKVLSVNNWTELMKKLNLTVTKTSGSFQSKLQSNPKISNTKIVYEVRKNNILNPGIYKFGMKFHGSYAVIPKNFQVAGLMWNSVGKADGDTMCWILNEKSPDGDKKCKVYKDYKKALKRVNKLKKLNRIAKYQYKLCKKCRNINLLSTTKVKACIEKYEIPYTKDKKFTGVSRFFIDLVKKWYKFRTVNAKADKYKVELTYTGKHFDTKGNLIKDEDNPKKKYKYKCVTSTKNNNPFPGFEFEKSAPSDGDEATFNIGCANYTTKNAKYKWSWTLATIADGKFPGANDKKKIYFASIIWKGTSLSRGFKCTSKGKKPSEYKKYVKTLKKTVKKRKKEIALCNRCKKHPIATKGTINVGWGNALFPIRIRTLSSVQNLPANLNVTKDKGGFKEKEAPAKPDKTEATGEYNDSTAATGEYTGEVSDSKKKEKKKKKGWGCKNPQFTWAKTTVRKKQYTKLKCKNCKPADPGLSVSSFQGVYHK